MFLDRKRILMLGLSHVFHIVVCFVITCFAIHICNVSICLVVRSVLPTQMLVLMYMGTFGSLINSSFVCVFQRLKAIGNVCLMSRGGMS